MRGESRRAVRSRVVLNPAAGQHLQKVHLTILSRTRLNQTIKRHFWIIRKKYPLIVRSSVAVLGLLSSCVAAIVSPIQSPFTCNDIRGEVMTSRCHTVRGFSQQRTNTSKSCDKLETCRVTPAAEAVATAWKRCRQQLQGCCETLTCLLSLFSFPSHRDSDVSVPSRIFRGTYESVSSFHLYLSLHPEAPLQTTRLATRRVVIHASLPPPFVENPTRSTGKILRTRRRQNLCCLVFGPLSATVELNTLQVLQLSETRLKLEPFLASVNLSSVRSASSTTSPSCPEEVLIRAAVTLEHIHLDNSRQNHKKTPVVG